MSTQSQRSHMKIQQMRIARPVTNLVKSREMYTQGLGLESIGGFEDHEGFSGCMLGRKDLSWHLEFTTCLEHPVVPSASPEDLLVLYIEEEEDWAKMCSNMKSAGFEQVKSFNPYWDIKGASFVDHDGYRVVIQNMHWG